MAGKWSNFVRRFGSLVGLFILCVVLTVWSDNFMSGRNIMNIVRQSSVTALLALGVLLPILTGGIDLSVGSIQGFTMCFLATMVVTTKMGSIEAILLTLLVGAAAGLVNGLLLTKLRLPHPFISTLGMLNIARGLALIITDGMPISGLPWQVRYLGSRNLGDSALGDWAFPMSGLLVIAVCLLYYVILNHMPIGRYVYSIGGSREAARLSGVNIDRVMNWVFVSSGFLSALAGIVLAGRVNSGYPLAGDGAELDAIAGAVIGGASLFGGEGTVFGTMVGVLIMGVLRNGLNLLNVSSFWQKVIIGLVVVLAVWVDVLRRAAENKAAIQKV